VAIALGRAKFELAADRADRVLVGTVDEITPILHAILDRFKALAVPEDDGVERARPFDRRRSGWLAAEGAVVAVLEREIDARQRGARVLARLLGAGSAFDPEAPRTGWGKSPRILADSLRAYLAREECETGMVNRVVTAAGGHPAADRLEGQLIREVWGESEVPPVLAPAAVSGAHGGSLLSAAILAAGNRAFGPTPGFGKPDPDIGVIPHDGKELPPASHILATACAAGGAAGWALFESPES
jgi:3-oxoacyl-(acyl-carrier-protein) synthase